jgi:GTPase SAR1 family protein
MYGLKELKEYESIPKIRLLCIGDQKVGRTTLLRSFCEKKPQSTKGHLVDITESTFAAEIHSKIHKVKDVNSKFLIEFMDIPGEKSLRSFIEVYFKHGEENADGLLFFFDVENIKTLYNFSGWMRTVYQGCRREGKDLLEIPIMLVANCRNVWKSRKEMEYLRNSLKQEVKFYFNCPSMQNLILLSKDMTHHNLDVIFFESFLNELCLKKYLAKTSNEDLFKLEALYFQTHPLITEEFKLSDKYVFSKFKLPPLDSENVKAFVSLISQKSKEKFENFTAGSNFFSVIIEFFFNKH